MKNKDLREQYKDVKYDEDDIEATLANADDAINKLMVNIYKLQNTIQVDEDEQYNKELDKGNFEIV